MKYFTFLLFVTILPFSLLAQNKFRSFPLEEPIFYKYYQPYTAPVYQLIHKYDELSSKYAKSILADGNSYLQIKNNKNYAKIEFEINGIKLYCSGKVKFKNNRNYFKIEPSSDLFYLSNNQIFCGLKDIEEFKLKNFPTIYNEDGSYLFHKELNEDQITQKVISQKSNTNYNFIINTYKDDKAPDVYNEKYGYLYTNSFYGKDPFDHFIIAPQSKEISTILLENGDRYSGFATIGTYDSQKFGSFTGYLFPMQKSAGNASVLFREFEGKYEWVLVVDNQIEMSVPAKAEEQPQFDVLMNNLENTIGFIKNPKVQFYADIVTTCRTNFGVYRNKNINTLNGYGVNFISKDSIRLGDSHFIELGFFKNGKLEGLGYRCEMKTFYNKPITENQYFDNNSSSISEKVVAQAGIFKGGKLIKGRDINIENDNQPTLNFWSKNKIEGVDWIKRENFVLYKENIIGKIDLNQIKGTDEVHVERLGYNYLIKRIDLNRKAIVIENDGKEVYLNKDSGPVYLTYINKGYVTIGCPPTKYVKTYKKIDEVREVPGYKYDTRVVKGEYITTYYTTKTKQTYTHEKTVFDDYKTIPCPICNGTGNKKVDNSVRVFREIVF
ncbi:hypothetical protein FIA58_020325 [Flavobacterium jejuense]|uniref:WG repeat-containing protein n=1 Tax=Flavobacterium jejuense TaxID=1544455 RepID=A0ABX0J1G8_9FLAO|nr:hypothetical protein [Flavobacterium jejuense]NHN28031.1 hypothetical protein [Flavobacterium jejuense]